MLLGNAVTWEHSPQLPRSDSAALAHCTYAGLLHPASTGSSAGGSSSVMGGGGVGNSYGTGDTWLVSSYSVYAPASADVCNVKSNKGVIDHITSNGGVALDTVAKATIAIRNSYNSNNSNGNAITTVSSSDNANIASNESNVAEGSSTPAVQCSGSVYLNVSCSTIPTNSITGQQATMPSCGRQSQRSAGTWIAVLVVVAEELEQCYNLGSFDNEADANAALESVRLHLYCLCNIFCVFVFFVISSLSFSLVLCHFHFRRP